MMRELSNRICREPLLVCSLALLLILCVPVTQVMADTTPESPDQLELARLTTSQLDPAVPGSGMRIETQVSYRLTSMQSGFLTLVLFEDDAKSPSGQSTPIPITVGSGKVNLDIEYPANPKVQALSLLIAMFSQDRKLIGWLATNPLPVSSLGGRLAFQNAMAARQGGDNTLAIERLNQAISLSPETGTLYYWRADTLLRQGDYDGAINDYTTALSLMSEDVASMVGRGVARVWKEQWDEGIGDLTAAIGMSTEDDPETASAHRARGVAYAAQGRNAEAIADYEAYLSITPDASDRARVESWIDVLRAPGPR